MISARTVVYSDTPSGYRNTSLAKRNVLNLSEDVRTVVELDVVPVDDVADRLVDLEVTSSAPFATGGEPGSKRGMGDDVLSLGEESTDLSGESDEPVLRAASAAIEGGQVLVINIDT